MAKDGKKPRTFCARPCNDPSEATVCRDYSAPYGQPLC